MAGLSDGQATVSSDQSSSFLLTDDFRLLTTQGGKEKERCFTSSFCQRENNARVKGKQKSRSRFEASPHHLYTGIHSPAHIKSQSSQLPTGSHPHTAFVLFVQRDVNYRPCYKSHLSL